MDMQEKIPLLAIAGPTASGKTKLAVELAKAFDGEVISADSMQVYRGMAIGTAQPTLEEMEGIPHHLIGFLDPDEAFSVAQYVELARAKIREVHNRGKLPILAGGTGLYLSSVVDNIDFHEIKSHPDLRRELEARAREEGGEALLRELQSLTWSSAVLFHRRPGADSWSSGVSPHRKAHEPAPGGIAAEAGQLRPLLPGPLL